MMKRWVSHGCDSGERRVTSVARFYLWRLFALCVRVGDRVKVTTFKPEYRDAFKELNLEWIRTHFKVEKKDLEQLENPEAIRSAGGEVFFICEDDGTPAATAALIRMDDGGFQLAKMAVRPDQRGKKLGDLLMRLTEAWARERKAARLYLISNTDLEPAIALYLKHGFSVISVGQHSDYERGNIVMEKRFA
jgi:putative acetyltransferase